MSDIHVVGGGLAGCEAAWQAAKTGASVTLWEMRPQRLTPAHQSGLLAELVCSNSLGSMLLSTAKGLLQAELSALGSLIMEVAKKSQVPAGGALAVDRNLFGHRVTETIYQHPRITVRREEVTTLPDGIVVIASGPLSSPAITEVISDLTNKEHLHFFDAAAPIVYSSTVDYQRGFWGARYNKGEPDYFNCPLDQTEYLQFHENLLQAETARVHEADKDMAVFEACMPVEVMAARGIDTLRYGPMRPVGLKTAAATQPYAVVQLRQEDRAGSLLNLVGFQTRLAWSEQRRVFRMIPALSAAEFARFGVMHRNTFIASPGIISATYQMHATPRVFVAGQVTGVEGYLESTSSGLIAGRNAALAVRNTPSVVFPPETMIGALADYVAHYSGPDFQPMNANFGLVPPLQEKVPGKLARKEAYGRRSLALIKEYSKTQFS